MKQDFTYPTIEIVYINGDVVLEGSPNLAENMPGDKRLDFGSLFGGE